MEKIILLTEDELHEAILKAITWYFSKSPNADLSNFFDKKNTQLEFVEKKLPFSMRTYNALKAAKINTLADIVLTSRRHVSALKNMGAKGMQEIENILKFYEIDWC